MATLSELDCGMRYLRNALHITISGSFVKQKDGTYGPTEPSQASFNDCQLNMPFLGIHPLAPVGLIKDQYGDIYPLPILVSGYVVIEDSNILRSIPNVVATVDCMAKLGKHYSVHYSNTAEGILFMFMPIKEPLVNSVCLCAGDSEKKKVYDVTGILNGDFKSHLMTPHLERDDHLQHLVVVGKITFVGISQMLRNVLKILCFI